MKKSENSNTKLNQKDRLTWSVPSLNDLSSKAYMGATCNANGSSADPGHCYSGGTAGSACDTGTTPACGGGGAPS